MFNAKSARKFALILGQAQASLFSCGEPNIGAFSSAEERRLT